MWPDPLIDLSKRKPRRLKGTPMNIFSYRISFYITACAAGIFWSMGYIPPINRWLLARKAETEETYAKRAHNQFLLHPDLVGAKNTRLFQQNYGD